MHNSSADLGLFLLAFSIGILPAASLAAPPINSYNDGRIISGGTYANTVDGKTTFANSSGGGIWLKTGSNLRGIEVNASGNPTNNGGILHFYAPNSVVRLDGNVDVSSLRNQAGASLANGGKVFVDSAYLFQNGNIFANGQNGGLVQVNVGGMTLGNGARIEAKGVNGAGGVVAINASGPVDLRRGSVIDTSGRVIGSFDTNLINIEGSLVNNEGALRADGVNSRGGSIRLVANGQSPYQEIKETLQAATVRDTSAPTISDSERTFLLQRTKGLIDSREGQVFLSRDTSSSTPTFISNLSVNGTGGTADPRNDYTQSSAPRAGDGGNITVLGMQGIQNLGNIKANGAPGRSSTAPVNGGNGGTISLLSQAGITNTQGRLEVNGGKGGASTTTTAGGKGGDGGLIAFGYNGLMTNTGGLYADGAIGGNGTNPGRGGNGGLVIFSGNNNPIGNGSIDVIARPGGNNNLNLGGKAGTIVSPHPGTLGQSQVYYQQGYVNGQLLRSRASQQTQSSELLTHHENLIHLTKNGGSTPVAENLFQRMSQSTIRSVEDPTGTLGQARTEVINKNTETSAYVFRNLLLGSSRDNLAMVLSHPTMNFPASELLLPSPLSNGQAFTTLNTLSVVNDGPVSTQVFFGDSASSPANQTDFWLIGRNSNNLGGGRISLLANGDVNNRNVFGTVGTGSGGSVNIATSGNFNNNVAGYGGDNLTTSGAVHGGSILIKAGQNIYHNQVNYFDRSILSADGGLMGGTVRLTPKNDFIYAPTAGSASRISANGSLQGGIIEINAGHNSQIVEGENPTENPESLNITANGTSPNLGRGGFIHIHANNANIHSTEATIQADGGLQDGTVLFTTGN